MQTNCEAEAITSIYSPSVLWLSSRGAALQPLHCGEGEESRGVLLVLCEGGGGGGASHSVIQRVVSPHSAAGRGFTAKGGNKRKEQKLPIH